MRGQTKEPIEWAKARCPFCGRNYSFVRMGYKPATCNKFECLQKAAIKGLRGGKDEGP